MLKNWPFYLKVIECELNQETPLFIEGREGPVRFTLFLLLLVTLLPYISGSDANLDSTRATPLMRMRGVCESVLEARLSRLVRRQKFEEAEAFARKFRLNLQEIFIAKVAWMLERLSPWDKESKQEDENANHFQELKICLGKIKDLEYVVRCCVTAALATIEQTRELLRIARELIESKSEAGKLNAELMAKVSETTHLLETFELIQGSSLDVKKWISFCGKDLIVECYQFLKTGQLEKVLLVWTRHKRVFISRMEEDEDFALGKNHT